MVFRRTAYVSAGLLLLLLLLTLCPIYLVPEVTEAATKDANPATLTYNATSSAASVSLTVSDSAGVFASSNSNELASFGISTNNATGYTLNLKVDGTGDTTSLSDGTNTIASITNTSGITADNFSNNTWGLLPSKYNGTANTTNYYPASTTGFKMDETSAANTTANTYTVGLGIKVNHNTPAGTYTNTAVVAEYVANAVTYSINYYTNTTDTVTGMPSINPQTGTVTQGTTSTSVNLASVPSRTGYNFLGWCMSTSSSSNVTTTNGVDTCGNASTNQFTAGQSFGIDATRSPDTYYMYAMWQIQSYTQTVRYRYENADGSFGSYTTVTETKNYGTTYSWSTANISNFDSTIYQSNSITSYNVTGEQSTDINIYRNTFTCTKRYRLQNADGTFPSTYDTSEGTITGVKYGASCSYTKTITDYRGSSTAANGASGTGSSTNVTSNRNIDIDFYRNTYSLTVSAGTNTSSPTGSGTYRWGQTVTVGVTKATDVTCTTYATPTWIATAGTAPSAGASTTFTMPKSDATVTASSTASSVQQSITLTRSGGASGINIGGTNYTSSPISLYCGTYNISGNYSSGYEFSSWAVSGSLTLGSSTTTASNTITVSGSGTLTLNGKLSCQTTVSGTMQAFNPCSSIADGTSGTLTDARDSKTYTVKKINGQWWMTQNLRFTGTSLDSTTSNVASTYTTSSPYYVNGSSVKAYKSLKDDSVCKSLSLTTDNSTNLCMQDSGSTSTGVWYNYAAASAGTITGTSNSTAAQYDICPKNWHLPSGPNTTANTDINKLVGNTTSGWQDPTTGLTAFSAVAGGQYYYGSSYYTDCGYWWSATAYDTKRRYYLDYDSSDGQFRASDYAYRYKGFFVRCVRSS